MTPTDELTYELDQVVTAAYMDGFSVKSNYARQSAVTVAAAASMGLITTEDLLGNYTRIWRPTHAGLLWIRSMREGGL